MLRAAGPSINDEIDEVVTDLLREETDYDRMDSRSAHREHLVRAVHISALGQEQEQWSFSRNISLTGIGLITQEKIAEDATAVLTIERLDGYKIEMLATCRWCSPYGKTWFMSGWQFINVR